MANEQMRANWTIGGEGWVAEKELFDVELAPFGDAVLAAAQPGPGDRVLDIGCGTGTISAAVSATGATAVGVDISPVMVEAAERFVPDATFLVADAQTQDLAPHGPFTPAPRDADKFPGLRAPRGPAFNEADMSDKPAWIKDHPKLTPKQIKKIDTSKAEALKGVKAVVTAKDLPEQKFEYIGPERVAVNFWHVTRNILAREKALYEGHAVAAVAATSMAVARKALKLIEVDYEILPHVIDVVEAMEDWTPMLGHLSQGETRGSSHAPARGRHPRDVRVLPGSRDFH